MKEGGKGWKERRLRKEESEGILKLLLERVPGTYCTGRRLGFPLFDMCGGPYILSNLEALLREEEELVANFPKMPA